jgi:hypothetical protein
MPILPVPCSFSWKMRVDASIDIQQVAGIAPAAGAVLVAKTKTAGGKVKGIGDTIGHDYTIAEAADGTDQWIMPLAPGIAYGIDDVNNDGTLLSLRCDEAKNIVTYRLANDSEAFLMTTVPPQINDEGLRSLAPIRAVLEPGSTAEDRPPLVGLVNCSFQWTLDVDSGIQVGLADIDAAPSKGSVLRVARFDQSKQKKSLTIALSNGGHFAAAKPVDKPTEDDEDETKPGTPKIQEWLLRLAEGITPTPNNRTLTLTAPDKSHHIVAIKLTRPAEIAFLVTPVPPLNPRSDVETKNPLSTIIPK